MEPIIQNNINSETINDIIKPINRESVHKICSGQVVTNLGIAVKELIENSIDSKATIIDINLNEYGADLIEVSDNGCGVLEDNFQALTLKHHTSKLKEFSDLASISTLGFRGEALSSLCALCNGLTIVTKHSSVDVATKICYDNNGKITSQTPSSRQQGTTVSLENLFNAFPVRRKEFMKNLKRDFSKMCQILYAYCLVSTGIKFRCTNQTKKGFRTTIVSTEGAITVRENIINVFGAKQISSLIDVEITRPGEQELNDYSIKLTEEEDLPFDFEFLISSVEHGSGRSATDRQFYFINSRPCEPTKLVKLVNEIYKNYNSNQFPFVYLNVKSKSCLVDVNVTPDKRQIFLEKEKFLLATIHSSLHEVFKTFPSTYKLQNVELSQKIENKPFYGDNGKVSASKPIKRSLTDSGLSKGGSITERFKKRCRSLKENFNEEHLDTPSEEKANTKLDAFLQIASKLSEKVKSGQIMKPSLSNTKEVTESDSNLKTSKTEDDIKTEPETLKIRTEDENTEKHNSDTENENAETTKNESSTNEDTPLVEVVEVSIDHNIKRPAACKTVNFNISLDSIKESLAKINEKNEPDDIEVRFHSKIAPEANKAAEEELQKQISKSDFNQMEIIGQLNLGFIITKLNSDLFIIDQHATDEKYNFEQLQANTVLESQVLVNPKPLDLTAGYESLLIENIEIFKKNGFTFNINHSASCTKKVSLTAIPISKNYIFGVDDINEMLFMLQDSNDTMCRPSRVRAMFASRACRKSIMIGKSLSRTDMRKLVDHMSEIDQPWNCPHGRPTMRHLINLNLIETD